MKLNVTVQELTKDGYKEIECSTLSQAIAILFEGGINHIKITDENSTGEINITADALIEYCKYNS